MKYTLFTLASLLLTLTSCMELVTSNDSSPYILSGNLIGGQEVPRDRKEFSSVVTFKDGISCTGVKIGPGLYLLAAHCVSDYLTGEISSKLSPGNTLSFLPHGMGWKETKITKVHVHPSYRKEILKRVARKDDEPYYAGYISSDLAIIKIKDNFNDIKKISISFDKIDQGQTVSIMGTGCEISTKSRMPYAKKLKVKNVKVVNKNYSKHNFAKASPDQIDAVNYLTEGRNLNKMSASLCSGDSGGPVFTTDAKAVIGVNSYYTFNDGSGVSYTNLHARLDPEDVRQWIESVGREYDISL